MWLAGVSQEVCVSHHFPLLVDRRCDRSWIETESEKIGEKMGPYKNICFRIVWNLNVIHMHKFILRESVVQYLGCDNSSIKE